MQRELYDPARLNGKHNGHTPETTPDGDWNGSFMEYGTNSTEAHTVSEQMQAYAAGHYTPHATTSHESPPDEYAGSMSSRNEKVTSYRLRNRSHKSWWAITIVIIAFLFLGLGRLSSTIGPQFNIGTSSKSMKTIPKPAVAPYFPFTDPIDATIMQNTLSSALHLTPQQMSTDLHLNQHASDQIPTNGSDLDVLAASRGVSASQLSKVEMSAFNQIINDGYNRGEIDSQSAKNWLAQLNSDSNLRDKIVLSMLSVPV